MDNNNTPRLPHDLARLFPHRVDPAFLALDELHGYIVAVIAEQSVENELDELQEPLAELSEEIIEIASGDISLDRWRKHFNAALLLCRRAKESLPSLVRVSAMSAAQSLKIAAGIDLIIERLTTHWLSATAGPDQ